MGRTIAFTILILLFGACTPANPEPGAAGLGDPYFPLLGNGGYDAQHYTLDLSVNVENNSIAGTMTMEARATQALSAFNLDFVGMAIRGVTVNGRSAAYSHEGSELTVIPPAPLREGFLFTLVVSYEGTPEPLPPAAIPFASGWTHHHDRVLVLWGPGSARTWFPNNDYPTNRALYTLRIKVPQQFMASANGLLVERIEDGDSATVVWELSDPIYSDGVTLDIAEYVEESTDGPGGLPISTRAPRGMPERRAKNVVMVHEQLPAMIEFLSNLFGPFPFESLSLTWVDQVLAAGFSTPTRLMLHPFYASSPSLMVHELAHQWFGNSVSVVDQQYWLAEGPATYAEFLWHEHMGGSMESAIRRCYGRVGSRTPPLANPPTEQLLDDFVYDRAALTFHALRVRVGDEAFFRILRTFVCRYRHDSASTADFIALAERPSGQDLSQFFDDCLNAEEMPPIEALGLVDD